MIPGKPVRRIALLVVVSLFVSHKFSQNSRCTAAAAIDDLSWVSADPFESNPKQLLEALDDIEEFDGVDDVQLIHLGVVAEVDANGMIKKSEHRIFKVLSKGGIEQVASISEPWTP